jgi:hypothetical protein
MANLAELAKKLDSSDQVQNYQARLALSRLEAEAGTADKTAERKALAAELAKIIGETKSVSDPKKPKDPPKQTPVASVRVRNTLIRSLASVATAAEVDTLAKALDDFEVREMARWALDRVTAQNAADALATAATKAVGVEFRIGVLNTLGRKPTASNVVAALKECAQDTDPHVQLAAIEALANHPDAAHDTVITAAAAQRIADRRAGKRVARARLRLAEGLVRAGQKDAARKIYADVAASSSDEAQKKAAAAGLKNLG